MTTRQSLGCRAALEGREEGRVISACAGAAAVAGRNYVGSVVDLRQNVRFLTLDTAVAEAVFVEGSKKTYHFHSFVGGNGARTLVIKRQQTPVLNPIHHLTFEQSQHPQPRRLKLVLVDNL